MLWCEHTHRNTHTHTYTLTHTQIETHVHTHRNTHTHTHTETHIHTINRNTHSHTHTHTKEGPVSDFLVLKTQTKTGKDILMSKCVSFVAVCGGSSLRPTAFETDFSLTSHL